MSTTRRFLVPLWALANLLSALALAASEAGLLGPVGWEAVYQRTAPAGPAMNALRELSLRLGDVESASGVPHQWLQLRGTKANDESFTVWILASAPISPDLSRTARTTLRYILQEGSDAPQEYVDQSSGRAALPTLGDWEFMWPQSVSGRFENGVSSPSVRWLGHVFTQTRSGTSGNSLSIPAARRLALRTDLLLGVPSNSRTRDNTRRFDESEYPMVRLSRADYTEMMAAGMNCFRVDAEQAAWLKDEPVFFWGLGGAEVRFPECLYRTPYLGPALFLDEPAVGTRDYDVRPRLAKEPDFRRNLTPQVMFEIFRAHYHKSVTEGAPAALFKGLRQRTDLDLGTLRFPQRNLYSWETMISTAAWELSGEPENGPAAIVFEPPGRLGSRRTVPEWNMVYGCQLSPGNPASLSDPIFGFLRGAARATGKDWGVSIYGAVDPADAPWLFTHAYDLGAKYFFFWDNYQLACVPYGECLQLSRLLQAHAARHPQRDLSKLRAAADTLILLPSGYDLGHTHMGRGNLWGITELNLERRNARGVTYREVMHHAFTEIERCLRLNLPFDLRWDLPGLTTAGYREVVNVREDGRVEISSGHRRTVRRGPRLPERGPGAAPQLMVALTEEEGVPRRFLATAQIREGAAPVFYTYGADRRGVHHNTGVLWELFGPQPEDYRQLADMSDYQRLLPTEAGYTATKKFSVERPGHYRLRAATTDTQGRSTVIWREFSVKE